MSNYEEGLKLIKKSSETAKTILFLSRRLRGSRALTEYPARLSVVWTPIMKTAHFML